MSTQGSPEKPPVAQSPPRVDLSRPIQVQNQALQASTSKPDAGDDKSGVPVASDRQETVTRKRRRWRELRIEPNKQAFERVAVQFRKLAWVAPAALVGYGWVQGGTIYGTLIGVGVGLLLLVLAFVFDSLDPGDPT